VKLFEGINEKGKENNSRKNSLTLNFDKENPGKGTPKPKKGNDVHWNDVNFLGFRNFVYLIEIAAS